MPMIFGIHPVREALAAGEVERLLVQADASGGRLGELISRARGLGVDIRHEPKARLDQLANGTLHQGIAALVAGRRLYSLEDLLAGRDHPPLLLLLDGIEDPHNLGAIIRSAEGAGVTGLVLTKRRSSPLSDTVWKISSGAVQHVPVAKVPNLAQAMDWLKEQGVWITGTAIDAPLLWHEADFTGPLAIVLGREGEGMHRLVREKCDYLVRLPMAGRVESLNVSVSAGILLYEAVRQRARGHKG